MILRVTTDALAPQQQRAPSAAQVRIFWLLSLLYVAIMLAMLPYATEPGPADPRIVVVYSIGIMVAHACTAALLGALYRNSGRTALLLLTAAYLYSALMAGVHLLTFPGALSWRPAFGNLQTVGWLFLAWRRRFAA